MGVETIAGRGGESRGGAGAGGVGGGVVEVDGGAGGCREGATEVDGGGWGGGDGDAVGAPGGLVGGDGGVATSGPDPARGTGLAGRRVEQEFWIGTCMLKEGGRGIRNGMGG